LVRVVTIPVNLKLEVAAATQRKLALGGES